MKRAAIYARYSSDLQSPDSIRDQIRLCEAFVERQGWAVVARFHDAATSGVGVDHRPGYRTLMATALETPRPFDVVLVEDLSRLTRELSESDLLYRRLRLRGIDLVGVSDGLDTSRRGAAAHIAMKGAMNAIFLEDLAEKTHRGLAGRVERGMSAGGRLFGYRAVRAEGEPVPGKHAAPARLEVLPAEAAIVSRVFHEYADGRSMAALAHALNHDAVPFPAKDTKRGPARRGWAVSTIHTILNNEKYIGLWVWNKTRFLKDPESGRRRPVPRPPEEWVRQERPDLRIVDPSVWAAVQARVQEIRERFGAGPRRPPRNGAGPVYSPYLLAGLLRCGVCQARISAQTAVRRKAGREYRYGWYRCGFARDKGPAVCTHARWYRQAMLEAALVAKFREATTPAMISALVGMVNARVEASVRARDTRADTIKAELLRVEGETAHLVRYLATGGDSEAVRAGLRTLETALAGLRLEFAQHESSALKKPPLAHRGWIEQRLAQLDALLGSDPQRARAEIRKHLEEDLSVKPLPAMGRKWRAEIIARVKQDSLLGGQEAVRAVVGCGGWI